MTAEATLLPCLSCGCLAIEHQHDGSVFAGQLYENYSNIDGHKARCEGCGLQTCWWHTKEEMSVAWNRRAISHFKDAGHVSSNGRKWLSCNSNSCLWNGPFSDGLMCGSVGPLCPKCYETTEECPPPLSALPPTAGPANIHEAAGQRVRGSADPMHVQPDALPAAGLPEEPIWLNQWRSYPRGLNLERRAADHIDTLRALATRLQGEVERLTEDRDCAREARDFNETLYETEKRRAEAAEADAGRYLNAIFAMADDGWLYHGVEGMDDTQKAVYAIAQEHPEYKRRAAAKDSHEQS